MKKYFYILICFIFWGLTPKEHSTQIFLVGDSTMSDKTVEETPERGWGQLIPQYFEESLAINNYAVNGRSTKSFIDEGRWGVVLAKLRAGDWVMIQFGHNDAKEHDPSRYAHPQLDYQKNLEKFVLEARKKGAKPILITPVARREFDTDGKLIDTHGKYPQVVRNVAKKTPGSTH